MTDPHHHAQHLREQFTPATGKPGDVVDRARRVAATLRHQLALADGGSP